LNPQPVLLPGPTSPWVVALHAPRSRFLSPRNLDVRQMASMPANVFCRSAAGSPFVKIVPIRRFSLKSYDTRPASRFVLGTSPDGSERSATLPEGNFVQRSWSVRGAYAGSPNLVLSSFIQYDTASENVGTNTRLRWTIRPGNDLFIVWNRGWQRIVTDPHLSIVPQSDLVALKLRWTFRP